MIVLLKVPVPVPLVVLLADMVGFIAVDQQTPLAVTLAPPSEVIFPPDKAVEDVIFVGEVVLTVARLCEAVGNDSSLPYDVPTTFIA